MRFKRLLANMPAAGGGSHGRREHIWVFTWHALHKTYRNLQAYAAIARACSARMGSGSHMRFSHIRPVGRAPQKPVHTRGLRYIYSGGTR